MIFPYPPELVLRFAGRVQRVEVPDGDRGTEKVLGLARDSINFALQDDQLPLWVREKILAGSGVDPRDAQSVFAACYAFQRRNIGFQPDPLVYGKRTISDYVQSPHYTWFKAGFGDCLAHAIALAELSVCLGHGAKIRTLRLDLRDPSRGFSHVYALLGAPGAGPDGGDWVAVDTTTPEPSFGLELPNLDAYDPHDILIAPAS